MTLATDKRTALIAKMAQQVTLKSGVLYPELETALGALIDSLGNGEAPPDSLDWPALICEGTNIRPKH